MSGNKESSDNLTREDKENINNHRLMQRLTATAANNEHSKSKITTGMGDKSQAAINHEEWVRKKEHETKLKAQLVIEAKKDLLEQIVKQKEEEELKR